MDGQSADVAGLITTIFFSAAGYVACGVKFIPNMAAAGSALRKDWDIITAEWRRAWLEAPRLVDADRRNRTWGAFWHDATNSWIEVRRHFLCTYEHEHKDAVASWWAKFEAFLALSGWAVALLLGLIVLISVHN